MREDNRRYRLSRKHSFDIDIGYDSSPNEYRGPIVYVAINSESKVLYRSLEFDIDVSGKIKVGKTDLE
jgi:hypothetical protein